MAKKWSEMTKPEKRVTVAKDVLRHLKSKKYNAKRGSYIKMNLASANDNLNIKTHFDKIKRCKVCAMGACLLSITKFDNKLLFGEIRYHSDLLRSFNVKKLMSLFTPSQLMLIEQSFEGYDEYSDRLANKIFEFPYNRDIKEKANSFKAKYKTDAARMTAIMKNIIQNKGTFTP